MNENFILVGRKCFSLDLTNLEDEFVDFFSSSSFSSDAVSSNVVYLCSSSGQKSKNWEKIVQYQKICTLTYMILNA